ncbi:NAD-dependent protein deacylase [compost metagenome]
MLLDQRLSDALRDARHVLVFTGAGVSAESGIPTFRDPLTGLWANYSPADLATRQAFKRDPALVWGWYEWRRMQVFNAQPNAAHRAIAELSVNVPRLTVVTQNVDDLHERAGIAEVLHLHGNLNLPHCFACARPSDAPLPPPEESASGWYLEPPRCSHCGGRLRPGVVWFGENLPASVLKQSFAAAEDCDVLLVVGTSGVVEPAARIPCIAWQAGATVLHINPQAKEVRIARETWLPGRAGEVLPQLLREVFGGCGNVKTSAHD